MSSIPRQRREQITQWLQERPMLTIDELVARLGVSVMTVHRDLDYLARSGLVEKVHGGVALARAPQHHIPLCQMCHMAVSPRTTFVLHITPGEPSYACCPHCGLLLLAELPGPVAALVQDFIYGRMINARQAVYLLESDISLCCVPSALCFANSADAVRFQAGFGGQVLPFAQAQTYLTGQHPQV